MKQSYEYYNELIPQFKYWNQSNDKAIYNVLINEIEKLVTLSGAYKQHGYYLSINETLTEIQRRAVLELKSASGGRLNCLRILRCLDEHKALKLGRVRWLVSAYKNLPLFSEGFDTTLLGTYGDLIALRYPSKRGVNNGIYKVSLSFVPSDHDSNNQVQRDLF